MKELTLLLISWITLAHSQGTLKIQPAVIPASSSVGLPRVINGEQAKIGQFPYQAYISDDFIACGASIIHKRWLLTAAHCRPRRSSTSYAIIGTNDRSGINGTRISFEKFIAHKNFVMTYICREEPLCISRKKVINDIALIRLDEEIEFNDSMQPIKLARDESNDYGQVKATISGWGLDSHWDPQPIILQYASLEVISEKECYEMWRTPMKNQICTLGGLFQEKRQSPCFGDSGGPLVYNKKQIGIASYGQARCAFILPDVFTRVASYVPWIQEQLKFYSDELPL